jgi:hypothetical protein
VGVLATSYGLCLLLSYLFGFRIIVRVEWGRLGPSAKRNHRCCGPTGACVSELPIEYAAPRYASRILASALWCFDFVGFVLITVRVCGMLRPFLLSGEVYQARPPPPFFETVHLGPGTAPPTPQVNSKLLAPCPLSLWPPTVAVIFYVSTLPQLMRHVRPCHGQTVSTSQR